MIYEIPINSNLLISKLIEFSKDSYISNYSCFLKQVIRTLVIIRIS